ncbi:hypothetical protein BDZ94DRAFT_1246979 [Collybia nuda]|uniref:Uncharacterized protein n=1 Tax=Collybia nuda TaxID=64659 RepID=A0A9P6CN87_9AGAR|nr:hypothetical protein BDZ94DRAFT_1246979 [Collybia nuda]
MSPVSFLELDLNRAQIIVFNVFAFLGVFSILLVLVPALLSSRIKRSRSWFGVLATWMLYSATYLLLVGRQLNPEPPYGLCILQAALVYATTPMCSVATTCFSIDFFLQLSTVLYKGRRIDHRVTNLLFLFPWALGAMVFMEALLVVHDASLVKPNQFYCHIDSSVPTITNLVLFFASIFVIIPFHVYTGLILHRNWTIFKQICHTNARIAVWTTIKLSIFTLVVVLAVILSSVLTARVDSGEDVTSEWRIAVITLPTFSAVCLGFQQDILNTWWFWIKREPTPPSVPPKAVNLHQLQKGSMVSIV